MSERPEGERAGERGAGGAGAGRSSLVVRALKGLALALLPLVVLLCASELVLWTLGLGDPQERLSLSRGFDENVRYLVTDPDVPGGWQTQMYDGVTPEVHIPPKGSRLRMLMFGGSNTQGFPDDYLQEQLNLAAPDPGFEVINLGRAGYGSERVRILLDQALELQPDIVFIYSGHNEFVERGFAMELVEAWSQPWITRLVDRLSRLRTLNVLVSAFERRPPPRVAGGPRPEKREPRGEDFQGLTYDGTLLFYDVYRQNLQSMITHAREHGAQVFISTVIGNMLFPVMVTSTPSGISAPDLTRLRKLQVQAARLVPARLRAGLLQTSHDDPPIRLDPRAWGDSLTHAEVEERRTQNLALATAQAGAAGNARASYVPPTLRPLAPPLGSGPYWTDALLWTESVKQLLPTIAALHERRLTEAERKDVLRAVELLTEARALGPTDAYTLFELGVCTWMLGGDDAGACQLLRDSARYDRAPTRGNDITNGIVRALAAAQPELLFVDAEEFARGCCPGGLISYELMMDNCHLHPSARPVLMDQFIPGLLELGRRCVAKRVPAR